MNDHKTQSVLMFLPYFLRNGSLQQAKKLILVTNNRYLKSNKNHAKLMVTKYLQTIQTLSA